MQSNNSNNKYIKYKFRNNKFLKNSVFILLLIILTIILIYYFWKKN